MKLKIVVIAGLLLLNLTAQSQKKLSLIEALTVGLKNNYSILLEQNNLSTAQNNNTFGNAGMLPSLNATGSYVNTTNNTHQEYYDGRVGDAANAQNYSLNTGLALNWVLFNGMAMFTQKAKLNEDQKLAEAAYRNQIELTVANITGAYFAVVQQTKLVDVALKTVNFSITRKELMKQKYRIGNASELDYLQAVVDLNADSTALLKENQNLAEALANLNFLLGYSPQETYLTEDTIVLQALTDYQSLAKPLLELNSNIAMATRKKQIAAYNLRLAQSAKYPVLSFTSGYNFTKAHSQVGLIETNRNYGPNFGLNFTYNLFNGFTTLQKVSNARLAQQSQEIQLNETIAGIQSELYKLYTNYTTYTKIMELEDSNVRNARQNTKVALEKYRLGELNDLDFRQIQLKQVATENQLVQAQYQLKLLETELLRLSGRLITDAVVK